MTRPGVLRTTMSLWGFGLLSLCFLFYHSKNSSLHEKLDPSHRQYVPRWRSVNTTNRQSKTFFYNRVPKCGSRSLLNLIKKLSIMNNFTFSGSDDFKNMRPSFQDMMKEMTKIANLKKPAFYNRHIHFLDFKKYGYRKPIYINLIRDPIERFQSNYNYLKYGDFTQSGAIKNATELYSEDINECVRTNALPCRPRKLFCTGMYFCGFRPICTKPCRASANLAKKHIDDDYVFIGLTEEFENSIRILEKMFPLYFGGAVEQWSKHQEAKNRTASHRFDELTDESKKILKMGDMAFEYEVYNHAKMKFEALKRKYQIL